MKPYQKALIGSASGLAVLMIFMGLAFYVSSPDKCAVKSARNALSATMDNPESLKILSVSAPEVVYGRNYISEEEKMDLSMQMMKINDMLVKNADSIGKDDASSARIDDMMTRQMSAMTAIRGMMHSGVIKRKSESRKKGWKVRIKYEAVSAYDVKYQSEYWCILDKTGSHVVASFEIPVV